MIIFLLFKTYTMKAIQFRKMFVASTVALCTVFTFASCDKDDDDVNNNMKTWAVSGNAAGSQVVPAVNGTGTGSFSGTYDPSTRVLTYNSGWNGLTGAPTTAAFYNGASGSAGTVMGSNWTLGTGLTATGNTTGTMTLTADQANQLTNGTWYYSYGTTANPNGEVRGQLSAAQNP